ncbi:MAG TPA: nickel-responsive transcriptional regulator NikR [Chitinispirillaceae bacterium]|nr:nickel-responsive transcriptional regulator NikR [Chitinispirillaceae bacterium]
MNDLYRFGISLEKQLIDAFDHHIEKQNYRNRSEAIRDLIRKELSQKVVAEGGTVAGAITMTYDHHKRELVNKLIDIQHSFQSIVISTQHIHLDHHHCLEILAVKGHARDVEKLANSLKSQVGVMQVELSISAITSDD